MICDRSDSVRVSTWCIGALVYVCVCVCVFRRRVDDNLLCVFMYVYTVCMCVGGS